MDAGSHSKPSNFNFQFKNSLEGAKKGQSQHIFIKYSLTTSFIFLFQEKCSQYWPSDRSARYQCFVVDPLAEYNMPQYLLREFKVTDARDGQSRTVRQFQFTDWPEQGVPKLGGEFTDFVGQVHKTKEQFGQEGPITVHCRYVHLIFRFKYRWKL